MIMMVDESQGICRVGVVVSQSATQGNAEVSEAGESKSRC